MMLGLESDSTFSPDQAAADIICWTRMQSEAGQRLDAIIARKELERRAGNGLFLWGVGNAPGRLPDMLARSGARPPVVFSVMKTQPKIADSAPSATLAWRCLISADGRETPLPEHCLVTSRGGGAGQKSRHHALVCRSWEPLGLEDHGSFDPSAYRNLGGTGAPVGASQVTALLRRVGPSVIGDYRIDMRATLDAGLWVQLSDPVALCTARIAAIHDVDPTLTVDGWRDLVMWLREGPPRAVSGRAWQPALL